MRRARGGRRRTAPLRLSRDAAPARREAEIPATHSRPRVLLCQKTLRWVGFCCTPVAQRRDGSGGRKVKIAVCVWRLTQTL